MTSHGRGAATSRANGDGHGEKYRRRSREKRTGSLCKKAYELATLCDIEVAVISYLPGADSPTIWPPDRRKIELGIDRYLCTPDNKKLPKNQITLDIRNPAAGNTKDAGEASAVTDADRLRIPFPDDEDKLRAFARYLDSKIADVRRMIAVRRMEQRSDPGPSGQHRDNKVALGPAPAASSGDGVPGTADRDRGMVARDHGPVLGCRRPDFSAPATAVAAVAMGGRVVPNSSFPSRPSPAMGGCVAPNSCFPCLYCYCNHHGHLFTGYFHHQMPGFTGFGGRDASRDGSGGN